MAGYVHTGGGDVYYTGVIGSLKGDHTERPGDAMLAKAEADA